jgi:hypothetical protein
MMRSHSLQFVTAAIVAILPASGHSRTDDVQALVAAARQALGGEANLASVRSFTVDGRVRGLKYGSNRWSKFTIAAEFPDKFVRTSEGGYGGPRVPLSPSPSTAGGYVTSPGSALGFNGNHAIADGMFSADDYRDLDGVWRPFVYPQSELDEKFLERARVGSLPWFLGMFAQPMPGLPVQLEASTGPDAATTIMITGGGMERTRTLTFDPVSHLPASFDGTTFEDYRHVGPVSVPFRMRGADVETEITAIRINAKIDAKLFRLSGRQ